MIVTTAHEMMGRAPEKVLAVRAGWADEKDDVHRRLVRAVYKACQSLDYIGVLKFMAKHLHHQKLLEIDPNLLEIALTGEGRKKPDGSDGSDPDFLRFFRGLANRPSIADAIAIASTMRKWHQVGEEIDLTVACQRAYRVKDFDHFTKGL